MKKLFAAAAMLIATTTFAGVSNSKHNMNTFAGETNDVCYYCHAAHNTQVVTAGFAVPLWARNAGTAVVPYYKSNSVSVNVASLDVISQACMSCHDGSLDVGVTIKGDITAATNKITAAYALVDDLTNDHPVSLAWNAAFAGLGPSSSIGQFRLFGASGDMLTCASCHKVHDNTIAKFLRQDPDSGAFCVTCHSVK